MNEDQKYEQFISCQISNLKNKYSTILVFGASRASWYIIKVLEYYGIIISGIIDNDKKKHGLYLNYPVKSPLEMAHDFPDSKIYIGLFAPQTAKVVENKLQQYGFRDIDFSMEAFLFTYFTKVACRKCDKYVFAKSINMLFENYSEGVNKSGYNSKKHFISPSVTGYITQRCSLRCEDCGSLIPYYKSPINFSVEHVVRDIKRYAKAFDVVPEISLSGGEPFLHPEFHVICERISAIPNIIFINLVTNGTIIPLEETLYRLGQCGADIHQSDYGKLSKSQNELFQLFQKHNIYCDINFVNDNHLWAPRPKFKKYNRKKEVNNQYYKECTNSNRYCHQIMDGELHKCPASLGGTHQRLLADFTCDYITLHDKNKSDIQMNKDIRTFIVRDYAIETCGFCNLPEAEFVKPAVQLKVKVF